MRPFFLSSKIIEKKALHSYYLLFNFRNPCSKSLKSNQSIVKYSTKETEKSKTAFDLSCLHNKLSKGELSRDARIEIRNLVESLKEGSVVPTPSIRDLRLVVMNQTVPFMGFGLMDNGILIVAGDFLDYHLGSLFGISTLCAAALGNIISNTSGVMLGTVIEEMCHKLGLPVPSLTVAQRKLRIVRYASQFGVIIGLIIGCVIGMFPLLLINHHESKKEEIMDQIFHDVDGASHLTGAEITCLFILTESDSSSFKDEQKLDVNHQRFLCGKYIDKTHIEGKMKEIRVPLVECSIISRVASSKKAINIPDVTKDLNYPNDNFFKSHLTRTKSIICVPVFDASGNVIALLQAVNKIEKGSNTMMSKDFIINKGFTSLDLQVLKTFSTHVSIALKNIEEDKKPDLNEAIEIFKFDDLCRHSTT